MTKTCRGELFLKLFKKSVLCTCFCFLVFLLKPCLNFDYGKFSKNVAKKDGKGVFTHEKWAENNKKQFSTSFPVKTFLVRT